MALAICASWPSTPNAHNITRPPQAESFPGFLWLPRASAAPTWFFSCNAVSVVLILAAG
jgi:hypothetical protein